MRVANRMDHEVWGSSIPGFDGAHANMNHHRRLPLILASRSPRRRQLLEEAGYEFSVVPPSDSAECGMCSGENPAQLVARLAYQKAADVAQRLTEGLVLGCDTVAECDGQILGKPEDDSRARQMLQTLSGRQHRVFSGLCLWRLPGEEPHVHVDITTLRMDTLSQEQLEAYIESGSWEGKAGAFGYQDRLGWVHVVEGSESNVVGLPMELLAQMMAKIDTNFSDQPRNSEGHSDVASE